MKKKLVRRSLTEREMLRRHQQIIRMTLLMMKTPTKLVSGNIVLDPCRIIVCIFEFESKKKNYWVLSYIVLKQF